MIKFEKLTEPIINTSKVKLPTIKTFKSKLGEVYTINKRDKYNSRWITTELHNQFNKVLGKEIFSIDTRSGKAEGMILDVEPEYRRNKDFRIGELLRLSSIIGIMENNISKFEIHSKPSAIYFHAKYKFEPSITRFDERDSVLSSIIENSVSGYEEFVVQAKNIQNEIIAQKDDAQQRELCVKTNELLNRYLQRVMQNKDDYKMHPIKTGIAMVLTKEQILNNRDFFNSLFINHWLDYRI